MRMAADHNWNLQHGGVFPQPFYNQHVVSFQPSETVNNTHGLLTSWMNTSGGIGSTTGMILPGTPSIVSSSTSVMVPDTSSGNVLGDPGHGLKNNSTLAVDWTYEELLILKEGLIRYANETNIMKYIKIAAILRDKTVRDVAMRCRWMSKKESSKRRKQEDYFTGKKMKDRKEKMVDSTYSESVLPVRSDNMATCSYTLPDAHHINQFPEAPVVDNGTWRVLNENIALLKLISSNIQSNKVQENIHLFYRTRENIANILNSMNEMPGIMSQMPGLPISIDENLVRSLGLNTSQAHAHSSIQLKEERGGW